LHTAFAVVLSAVKDPHFARRMGAGPSVALLPQDDSTLRVVVLSAAKDPHFANGGEVQILRSRSLPSSEAKGLPSSEAKGLPSSEAKGLPSSEAKGSLRTTD
jgi:hypothetical protein